MCPSRPLALLPFMALAALSACQLAQAQMVPKAGHALHQNRGGSVTEARLTWLPAGSASTRGQDESLGLDGRRLSSHWEGRMGAMIDRPIDPLHDPLGASHAAPPGLRLRSLHLLSDYYLAGGLRATAGVVGGDTAQAWWGAGERGGVAFRKIPVSVIQVRSQEEDVRRILTHHRSVVLVHLLGS